MTSERQVDLVELVRDRDEKIREVLDGLADDDQKTLPCKWLYDERGSRLFDQICDLDAYYPTRTEQSIFEVHIEKMARLCGPQCELIEYGAGSVVKVRALLDALEDPVAVIPIDISKAHVAAAATELAADYPDVEVLPVAADYTGPLTLPEAQRIPRSRLAFFPGSTIGNFHRDEAVGFLRRIAKTVGPGGQLLIGVDRKKSVAVLERAYDDPEGITAAFNRNLLRHLNRELETNFEVDHFEHRAHYNEVRGRIEMHLMSTEPQRIEFEGETFVLEEGETIRTECSYKYSPEEFRDLAIEAGFEVRARWDDAKEWFSIYLLDTTG